MRSDKTRRKSGQRACWTEPRAAMDAPEGPGLEGTTGQLDRRRSQVKHTLREWRAYYQNKTPGQSCAGVGDSTLPRARER
jgi:hypothetical protein